MGNVLTLVVTAITQPEDEEKRLRCGNFDLRIRTGAWISEDSVLRTCRFCTTTDGCIENEYHIILTCSAFGNRRRNLELNIMEKTGIDINSIECPTRRIKYLMENKDLLSSFSKFVFDIWNYIKNFDMHTEGQLSS